MWFDPDPIGEFYWITSCCYNFVLCLLVHSFCCPCVMRIVHIFFCVFTMRLNYNYAKLSCAYHVMVKYICNNDCYQCCYQCFIFNAVKRSVEKVSKKNVCIVSERRCCKILSLGKTSSWKLKPTKKYYIR